MASGSLSLEGIRAACDELGSIARTLADEHSVTLIIGSDGTLSFTSQASRAISEAHHPHPLQKIIAHACEDHCARTGNDCKVFLALLGESLRLVARLARELGDICARRTLMAELSRFDTLLPDLFQGVQEAVGVISNSEDPVVFGKHLADVVRSRSETLSGIVSEFVRCCVPDWGASLEALDYLVNRFEDLCSKAVSAVDKSSVLKGFLLSTGSDHPRSMFNLRFVVVWDVSFKTDDVIWVCDAILQSQIWSRIEAILNGLRDRGISAILTPSAAPSRLHSFCHRLGISLVDRLSPGDLQNVLFFTGVVPLDTLNDSFEADCVLHVDSMRSVVFGGTQFLHLETSVTVRPFHPCHVVLCAPSSTVWKERYYEFLDCLKVLRQWLHPPDFQRLNESDLSKRPVCGVSVPLGSWELELKLALPRAESSCPNLCRLLDEALLTTACGAWGIPVCRYRGRESYEEYACRNGAKGWDPVVPAANAESVLLEMLQLLRQLLRIDAVVGSKGVLSGGKTLRLDSGSVRGTSGQEIVNYQPLSNITTLNQNI